MKCTSRCSGLRKQTQGKERAGEETLGKDTAAAWSLPVFPARGLLRSRMFSQVLPVDPR